ncbi:hypothetical protein OIU77_025671 [Salix suchowensis]|uniref:Uncharacterized protein n=1 Tax=Salix suchowensis TaxID=1278906 RepID=A0ABQ9BX13_9ROSI|nr:hypothetical protein OIU77_025671 [Salix suchowensis]
MNYTKNSVPQNDLLLGLDDEDDLDFAKSNRSLKSASYGFACFEGSAQRTTVFDYTRKAVVEEIQRVVHPKELGGSRSPDWLNGGAGSSNTGMSELAREKSSQHFGGRRRGQ